MRPAVAHCRARNRSFTVGVEQDWIAWSNPGGRVRRAATIHSAAVASFPCAIASTGIAAVAQASGAPGRETVIPRLEAALAVPEPTTLLLLAIALVALGYILRKRR